MEVGVRGAGVGKSSQNRIAKRLRGFEDEVEDIARRPKSQVAWLIDGKSIWV